MKNISIIVAVASNWAIGKDNELLWHLPNDLKWFKKHTSGNPVIMGKRTWESLPLKPLPQRKNIIISDEPDDEFEGGVKAVSIAHAIQLMDEDRENFIIGGGSIYSQFLPMAQKLYLTQVHQDFEADVFFPELVQEDWNELYREDHPKTKENPLSYSFVILERVFAKA